MAFLDHITELHPRPFEIIIDDASHHFNETRARMEHFFVTLLAPGGVLAFGVPADLLLLGFASFFCTARIHVVG